MKPLALILLIGAAGSGCATHKAAHRHSGMTSGSEIRVLEWPAPTATGEPREMHEVYSGPGLKVASIVLRGGTVLPTHQSPVPVTIVALKGSGTVVVGAERFRIDSTHATYLPARVPHAVEPDKGTELVLLVHHLGCDGGHGGECERPEEGHHGHE